jgi:hypothetical protein
LSRDLDGAFVIQLPQRVGRRAFEALIRRRCHRALQNRPLKGAFKTGQFGDASCTSF